MDDKIDFVVTWVDGSDKEWQKERNRYAGKDPEDLADYRFRDWDNLKYWFRGVEKYAPWVNNVYFVTNGQKPEWLNTDNSKLKWIKHEDFIPKEYLPTFSSHPIELNIHRIKGLSEHFVYFNDDMFLTNFVSMEDFFLNNLPRYFAQLDINLNDDEQFEHIILNVSQFVNRYLKLDDAISRDKSKWYDNTHSFKKKIKNYFFSRFHRLSAINNLHLPSPLCKSTLEELWELCPADFERTCKNKFRNVQDINQYVFSWYDILRGKFMSFNPNCGNYFVLGDDDEKTSNCIKSNSYKMICLNDTHVVKDFNYSKKIINDAFEHILPDKSSFEK